MLLVLDHFKIFQIRLDGMECMEYHGMELPLNMMDY
jgi:hypothetical protein